jgi:hypothetical protein
MIFFLAADNGLGPGTQTNSSYIVEILVYIILILVTLYLLLKYWPTLKDAFTGDDADDQPTIREEQRVSIQTQAGSGEIIEPAGSKKPKTNSLRLDDVSTPPPRQNSETKNTPSAPAPSPTPKPTMNEPTPTPVNTPFPGDFEKALAQAGQRMDNLLTQTVELTRLLKLAEKGKTDAQVELNKATTELTRQLNIKDEQISKLDSQLDRKASFPSLRALIDVKKLCLDMLNTQKEVPREEMIKFVTAEIDSQLANLEVQLIEFPVGTPLEKIPGEQVEVDRRHEPTDDPSKANQVARLTRPCYYLERDSKRIIIAKAVVVLHRYIQPSPPPEATPSTPAN